MWIRIFFKFQVKLVGHLFVICAWKMVNGYIRIQRKHVNRHGNESWVMRQPNQHLRDCLYFVDRHLRAIHMAPQTALPCHATCHPSFTYPINKSSKTSFNIKIYYTYSIYKDGTLIIFLVQNINKNFSINNINIIRFKTMLIYKNPN